MNRFIFLLAFFIISSVSTFGQEVWDWQTDFENSDDVRLIQLIEGKDGLYLVAQLRTKIAPYYRDYYVIKLDFDGHELWRKIIEDEKEDYLKKAIYLENENSIIIVGDKVVDIGLTNTLIVKLSGAGDLLWKKVLTDSISHFVSDVSQLEDENLLILSGYNGLEIFTLDKQGELLSSIKEIGKDSLYDNASILVTTDNQHLLTSRFFHRFSADSVKRGGSITKLEEDGTLLWSKYFKTEDNGVGFDFRKIYEVADGYIISGEWPEGQSCRIMLKKIDENGNLLWLNTYNEPFENEYIGGYSDRLEDGSFILCGSHRGDYIMVKTDIEGDEEWRSYIGTPEYIETSKDILLLNDKELVIGGIKSNPDEGEWYLNVKKLSLSLSNLNNSEEEVSDIIVFPTCFKEYLTISTKNQNGIEFSLIDSFGRKILNRNINSPNEKINVKNMVQGTYYWMVTSKNNKIISSGKVFKI